MISPARWIALVSAVAPGCAAGTLAGYRVSPDYPRERTESLALPGLNAPAEVSFDRSGVPHINARDDRDLARAVGFVHGRERFFEMDIMRRFATGRLSQLVGEQPALNGSSVDFDRSMRGWEMGERAAAAVGKMSASDRELLEAYAAGVNAAAQRYPSLEHRLLGVTPEPWRSADSLSVGLLVAWSVSHNWQQELARLLFALNGGIARSEGVYPAEPFGHGFTMALDGPTHELPRSVVPEAGELLEAWRTAHPAGPAPVDAARAEAFGRTVWDLNAAAIASASNAWVVSGRLSASGKPVVANDPHLSHLLPSIAFLQHQRAPGLDVEGMTVPGLPYVLSGHNGRIAWGITSTVADVMDLVVERPDASRPGFVMREGRDCPVETREETIEVKDAPARKLPLRRTCDGPVLNDMMPELLPEGTPLITVRWAVEGMEECISALAAVDRAGSVDELRVAVGRLIAPVNTFTAGDVYGHIGSFISGTVPLRREHRGTFPVPGWLARYEWSGRAASADLPAAIDPPEGFFAHANNLMSDPHRAPACVNIDAAPPYRFERIVERIRAVPKHDQASLAEIQRDVRSLRAERLMPRLLEDLSGYEPRDDADREALSVLRAWGFETRAGSAGAAIFFSVYRNAVLAAVSDELPKPALHFFMSQRYSTNVADAWFERPQHEIWDRLDTPEKETRAPIVRAAFAKAVDELKDSQGGRPLTWRWGRMHRLEPKHLFGGKAVLAGLVNLEAMEAGGELDTVWKSHFEMGDEEAPFKTVAGPVFRMSVDLADLAHGGWVLDTGESGWPGAPHYGDLYDSWKAGGLVPMLFDWTEIQREATAVLTLTP